MDLYTRCPNCDTTFRVTTQQLQASGGQVRCGNCQKIFDAFATLTAREPQLASPEPSIPATLKPRQEQYVIDANTQTSFAKEPLSMKVKPQIVRPAHATHLS